MKTLNAFFLCIGLAFGFIGGGIYSNSIRPTPIQTIENPTPDDISIEVSLGGNVKVLKAPIHSSIHIITNEEMELTDLQILPHQEIIQVQETKKHGELPDTRITTTGT